MKALNIQALEAKVKELEAKVATLESSGGGGGRGGTAGSKGLYVDLGSTVGDITSKRKPETWRRGCVPSSPRADLIDDPERTDGTGTGWVRKDQTFIDTQY